MTFAAFAFLTNRLFTALKLASQRKTPSDSLTISLLFLPVAFAKASSSAAICSGKLTDNTVLMFLTSCITIHYIMVLVKKTALIPYLDSLNVHSSLVPFTGPLMDHPIGLCT
jgi:hypothetical protein